jgi:uncharacterized paraquat-inducible protein A
MYCSSCGAAVTPGLSYCNRCGTQLNSARSDDGKPAELFPESLVWALVAVSVGGIGAMIGLMAVMKESLNFDSEQIVLFSLLSFAMLLGAEAVFIWMLLRRNRRKTDAKEPAGMTQLNASYTKELGEGQMPMEPARSVTEHTTHTLEPVYREPKTG